MLSNASKLTLIRNCIKRSKGIPRIIVSTPGINLNHSANQQYHKLKQNAHFIKGIIESQDEYEIVERMFDNENELKIMTLCDLSKPPNGTVIPIKNQKGDTVYKVRRYDTHQYDWSDKTVCIDCIDFIGGDKPILMIELNALEQVTKVKYRQNSAEALRALFIKYKIIPKCITLLYFRKPTITKASVTFNGYCGDCENDVKLCLLNQELSKKQCVGSVEYSKICGHLDANQGTNNVKQNAVKVVKTGYRLSPMLTHQNEMKNDDDDRDDIVFGSAQSTITGFQQITGEFLPRLDHPALSSVGITNIGDRITILDQIIKLCHNIPSTLPGSLLVDQIHNIKSALSPSKFVQTLSTPTIIPTATAKCSISTTSKASTSATPTPTPTYTTYKFGANKKKKEWWTSNTLYQDTKNRTKQLSKVFTKKWDKDASNIEAVPMGWIAIGIMGESSKQEIINFSKENFSKCKVGKMLGCLMPSRTGKTTTSSCNGYYFDINREEGKYAKKAAYAVIENNPYLKQIKAKYDKKQETNNDGTNNQEQSNDEHEKQEYQCNNDVDELINDKNEKQGINDNNKKRKLSISTALNGLEVQPLLKRRKIND